jgi:hypothetical protein
MLSTAEPATDSTASPRMLVVVTNYDFSDQASQLKSAFASRAPTLLIDASSPSPPRDADTTIPNTMYPGLWNAAVRAAIDRRADWLFFLASDVHVPDASLLVDCIAHVLDDDRIGCYTPSIHPASRCAYQACFTQPTRSLREIAVAEGFCFLARVRLLASIHPVPRLNAFGWSIDKLTAIRAHRAGLLNVVDDRVSIYHPAAKPAHAINGEAADRAGFEYLLAHHVTVPMVAELIRRDRLLAHQPRLLPPIAAAPTDANLVATETPLIRAARRLARPSMSLGETN